MDKKDKKEPRDLWLTLIDALSHERMWSIHLNLKIVRILAIALAVVTLFGIFSLIAYTPIRTLIPGYPSAQTRRQALQNLQRIDSLEMHLLQWELYSENLRRVVAGEAPIRLDSAVLGVEDSRTVPDERYYAIRDSLLREDVQTREQFQVADKPGRRLPIEALSFYSPVKGVISEGFELNVHPYIDVTAPAGSMVSAVLDGTIVHTSWDVEEGYLIVIQHSGDIISLYKHCRNILVKRGDVIKAGTPIGVVSQSESLTKGDHLHFELWYEGAAVDPSLYIGF